MRFHLPRPFRPASIAASLAIAAVLTPVPQARAQLAPQHYINTPLTSNLGSLAPITDANLVNAWGLSRSTGGAWWVSDNGTGLSTLYDGAGAAQPLVVRIPAGNNASGPGNPTGTVFNGFGAFAVAPGKPGIFLFVTEDGTISGWNPGAKPTDAIIVLDTKGQSVFKGAAIAVADTAIGQVPRLYVADFRRARVAVYDAAFNELKLGAGTFEPEGVPAGYAPFNIQNIGGNLYVAYAKQDGAKHDEVDGTGKGFVEVFDFRGRQIHRLAPGPWFNAPWGLAQAPGDFGSHSHDILVGQFGSGQILAFDAVTGAFKGALNDATDHPIVIAGLWALAFGGDAAADANGTATTLFYSAGPGGESNGLFGTLTAKENPQGNDR